MTRQKTITSISIAAIALLAAAVPSMAQAQSAQSSVASQAVEQTIAFNTELIAVAKTRVAPAIKAEAERTAVNSATKTALPKLSASAFKVPSSVTFVPSQTVSERMTFNGATSDSAGSSDPTAKQQFRTDDDDTVTKARKAVTFVPSRGQKLPE